MAECIKETSKFIIKTLEMHTVGDPTRIVLSGYPEIKGDTILAKRRYARDELDHLRKALMLEPRGHYDMYGAVLVKPDNPKADLAILFIHSEGYSVGCGHATIALARYAVDFGLVKAVAPETPVNIQCPSGLVTALVEYDEKTKRTGKSRFISVPAFAFKTDIEVDVPKYGKVVADISFGGNFYASVPADRVGLDLDTSPLRDTIDAAVAVTKALEKAVKLEHPVDPDMCFLYGTIITDGKDAWSTDLTKNVCVTGNGQVPRAPCGTGVISRVAGQLHKGLVQLNQPRIFKNASTKSTYVAKGVEKTKLGDVDAFLVEVCGQANYTGECTFFCEKDDDGMGMGFLVS